MQTLHADEQHCVQNALTYVADDGSALLAAVCAHLRCADGWQCEQSRMFAKCCRRGNATDVLTAAQIDGSIMLFTQFT